MRSKSIYQKQLSGIINLLISSLIGFAAVLICIAIFSLLITKINLNDKVLTTIALSIGAFTGGYMAAKRRRQNGLLIGLVCGAFMFAVIFFISYIVSGAAVKFSSSGRLILTVICASIGGISGVNSKYQRYRIR